MTEANWEIFSTDSVLPAQRVHRWNDFGSETLCNMTVDPQDRDGFNARLSRVEFGALGLITMHSTAAVASGKIGSAGAWAAHEKDSLLLILSQSGHSVFEQERKPIELAPGDLLIRDLSRPWLHSCRDELDMLMVKIPYSSLLTRVDDPGRLLGMTLSGSRPAVAMAVDVIRAVNRTLRAEPEGEWHSSLAELVLDSVRMIYQSTTEAAAWRADRHQRAAVRRDAKNFIVRHLEDPELSVANVADALGVGQRRLQRAFVEVSETPSQFILEQRLDLAARELKRASGALRSSILEIALAAGFSDASHFTRSFSRRYGVTPRHYRGTPPRSHAECPAVASGQDRDG